MSTTFFAKFRLFFRFPENGSESGSVHFFLQLHSLLPGDDHEKTRYVPWILAVEAVGILSAFLSRDGIELYAQTVCKPPLSPPGILFPIVWSVLYALMGVGAARIADVSDNRLRYRCWNIFVVQLVINFFWSLIFFNAQAYGAAFLWLLLLWALVLGMIFLFSSADTLAALLQIPYLLWVTFAGYLTYSVWMGNR